MLHTTGMPSEIIFNDRLLANEIVALQAEIDSAKNAIEGLHTAVDNTDTLIKKLTDTLGATEHVNFAFLKKLNAFFEPMLEGKNPPLDGNQVASKDYVDKALERLAGRIREQVAHAIELTSSITKHIATPSGLMEIGKRIAIVIDQPPSRLGSLVHALTGKNHGASR
jgi:hypothetical protein